MGSAPGRFDTDATDRRARIAAGNHLSQLRHTGRSGSQRELRAGEVSRTLLDRADPAVKSWDVVYARGTSHGARHYAWAGETAACATTRASGGLEVRAGARAVYKLKRPGTENWRRADDC